MWTLLDRLRRMVFGPAGIYLGASILARAGAILLIPLYTRRLSLAEYGDYALAQTIILFLPTVLSFGLQNAVVRFYFDGDDRETARLRSGGVARWMVLLLLSGASVLQLAVLAATKSGSSGIGGRWELSCMVWAGTGNALAGMPAVFERALQRPLRAAAFQLGQFFSVLISGIVFVAVLGRGLRGSIEAAALAYVIDGAVGMAFVGIVLRGPMTRDVLTAGLRFSIPFIPNIAANQLLLVTDRWILKANHYDSALGTYSLASQLVSPATMALVAWNDAESPNLGEIYRRDGLRGIDRNLPRTRRMYMLAAAAPVVLITCALPVAAVIVGKNFASALWMVPLMGISVIVDALYYPGNLVAFYASRTSLIPRVTVAAALIGGIMNIILIYLFGVWGAIVARISASACRSLLMQRAAARCIAEATA